MLEMLVYLYVILDYFLKKFYLELLKVDYIFVNIFDHGLVFVSIVSSLDLEPWVSHISIFISEKLSGLGLGFGLDNCCLDYITAVHYLFCQKNELSAFSSIALLNFLLDESQKTLFQH